MIVKVKPECKDKDPSMCEFMMFYDVTLSVQRKYQPGADARVVIKPSALQDNMIKLVTAKVGKVAR